DCPPARLRRPSPGNAPAPPRRSDPRGGPRGGRRARAAGLPRRPAGPPLLPRGHRPGADDRPAWRGPGGAHRGAAARAADRRAAPDRRQRPHAQDLVAAARRRPRRERAHALSRPRHRLHLQPGRLRHGVPVLRHRAGGADPQPVGRGDHRAGRGGRGRDGRRRAGRRAWPALQRRLHGHGRAAGQLRPRPQDPRRAAHPRAVRARPVPALGDRLDGGSGPRDPPADRGRAQRHPRRQPARPGRRAARHPRADQHPLEGRGGHRCRRRLRPEDGAAVLDRVRPDPRRQRPAVPRRPPGQAPGRQARPRQPDPAQPDAGQQVGRQPAAGAARVRRPAEGRGRRDDGPRHPRPGHRRRLRPARRGRQRERSERRPARARRGAADGARRRGRRV
ncbi:MAG: 23S rRNA (adenine(2503)-C(2))-methyltransferase @ tRNA (adenine(37)-C(2))-methyltransferase, partial [uncultured Blastococcus sp.]